MLRVCCSFSCRTAMTLHPQASIDQELKKARMLSGRTQVARDLCAKLLQRAVTRTPQTSSDAASDSSDVIRTLDELNVKIAELCVFLLLLLLLLLLLTAAAATLGAKINLQIHQQGLVVL